MDVSEKLVEQLREVASKTPPICRYDNPDEIEHFGKTITVYCKPFEQFQELMRDAADYIANGVTVQEWISVKDMLPDETGRYLVLKNRIAPDCLGGNRTDIVILRFFVDKGFRMPTHIPDWINEEINDEVTHWMPLPEPPKGGQT